MKKKIELEINKSKIYFFSMIEYQLIHYFAIKM